MELACELELVYRQELGDKLACEQGLDDTQVLVCVLVRHDKQERACEQELEQHIPHMIHQRRNQYSDQQCILRFDVCRQEARRNNARLHNFHQNLQRLRNWFQCNRRLHHKHNGMVWGRILVHDKKVQVYMMERGHDKMERDRLVLVHDKLVALQERQLQQ